MEKDPLVEILQVHFSGWFKSKLSEVPEMSIKDGVYLFLEKQDQYDIPDHLRWKVIADLKQTAKRIESARARHQRKRKTKSVKQFESILERVTSGIELDFRSIQKLMKGGQ